MDMGGGYDWTYGYDKTYQVTWADQGSATNRMVDWQYDSVYNRTYWSDTALGSLTYSDNAMNQYTATGAVAPAYDSRGNITSTNYGGGLALTYDAENRLTAAGPVTYDYDLFGRRSRLTYYLVTEYVWGGAHIIAEYMNGSLTKYIYGPGLDRPVAMIRGAGASQSWYYYYTDAIGSVRLMTNAAGTPVESYTYDAYGRPQVMQAAGADGNWLTEDVSTRNYSMIGNPIMFTGRWWHSRTGLYYYRFRDYDPQLGRFLQPDPAGYIDTMNLYAYCGNDPVNWIDPWGLCKDENSWLDEIKDLLDRIIDRLNTPLEERDLGYGAAGMTVEYVMGTETHHLLPQQFKEWFESQGLKINDYTIKLPTQDHRLKPNGLHTGKDNWNKQWKEFKDQNPTATREEILKQLEKMKKEHGL